MLVLDERQQNLLMTLKQSMTDESNKNNKNNIDNKISEMKVENKVTNLRTNDKIHNNVINKNVVMDKINYNTVENIDMKDIKRGDIIWVRLFGAVGSEQSSDELGRPCICIQNNVGNTYSPTIIVACITSQLTKTKLPVHVEIPSSEIYGLTKNSVVLLEQIRTIDKKKRILRKTGHLDELLMKQIDKGLLVSIFDSQDKTLLERLPEESRKYIVNKIRFIEKAKGTIDFLKSIKGDNFSINLAEDEIFREENALKSYCAYKNIDCEEVYKNYNEIYGERYEDIAL